MNDSLEISEPAVTFNKHTGIVGGPSPIVLFDEESKREIADMRALSIQNTIDESDQRSQTRDLESTFEWISQKYCPTFTVPDEYVQDVFQSGLQPRPNNNEQVNLAGSLGREPFEGTSNRWIFALNDPSLTEKYHIRPRLIDYRDMRETGGKTAYIWGGTVITSHSIPKEDLIAIKQFDDGTTITIDLSSASTEDIQEIIQKELKNIVA